MFHYCEDWLSYPVSQLCPDQTYIWVMAFNAVPSDKLEIVPWKPSWMILPLKHITQEQELKKLMMFTLKEI